MAKSLTAKSIIISGQGFPAEKEISRLTGHIPGWEIFNVNSEKGSIGIAEIKKALKFLSVGPVSAQEKAVIVRQAETLTQQAQNAMLKTLEEPPGFGLIILQTSNHHSLLPTVLSRAVIIRTLPPEAENNKEINSGRLPQCFSPAEIINFSAKIAGSREKALENLSGLIGEINRKADGKEQSLLLLTALEETRELIKKNLNPRLAVESILLKYFCR